MSGGPDLNQNQNKAANSLQLPSAGAISNAAQAAFLARPSTSIPTHRRTFGQSIEAAGIHSVAAAINTSLMVLKLPATNAPIAVVGLGKLGKLAKAIAKVVV